MEMSIYFFEVKPLRDPKVAPIPHSGAKLMMNPPNPPDKWLTPPDFVWFTSLIALEGCMTMTPP